MVCTLTLLGELLAIITLILEYRMEELVTCTLYCTVALQLSGAGSILLPIPLPPCTWLAAILLFSELTVLQDGVAGVSEPEGEQQHSGLNTCHLCMAAILFSSLASASQQQPFHPICVILRTFEPNSQCHQNYLNI
jgi:hypothetical protein